MQCKITTWIQLSYVQHTLHVSLSSLPSPLLYLLLCAVLEERLTKVQCESDAERSRLQGLIAKMETNLADQNRQLEKVPLVLVIQYVRG